MELSSIVRRTSFEALAEGTPGRAGASNRPAFTRRWLRSMTAFLLLAGASGGLHAQTLVGPNIEVSGTGNPWLAASGATDRFDSLPAESPITLSLGIPDSGTTLTFMVTGSVNDSNAAPTTPPDGDTTNFIQHAAENGFSGVIAPAASLVGVFVQDPVADPTNANAPAGLDFSNTSAGSVVNGTDYTTLAPALNQVFFIGDGTTSGGVTQQVTVPVGATGLALGSMDSYGWYDNTGGFIVNVFEQAAGTGSTTLTATTFNVDGYPANGSPTPPVITPGAPITFTATQGASAASGVYVRAQAAPVPADGQITEIPEGSWTDLTDTTNGGNGFLLGDGNGNYTLTTTQYPTGEVVAFRAISAAPGQMDKISVPVGPFDFSGPAPATGLSVSLAASTPDDPTGSVAIVGDQITYKYSIVNSGTTTLTNVKLTIVLPTTLQYQSADNGFVLSGNNVLTDTFPTFSPTTGTPVTLTVVASVTSAATVGTVIVNNGFSVGSDTTGIVQGAVPAGTTILPPLEIVVSGGSQAVTPGQDIIYRLTVNNRSPDTIKGIRISVPLPGPTNLLSAGFTDSTGDSLSAPTTPDGSANPMLNGTNVNFYFDKVKPGKSAYLYFSVVFPLDADPTTAVVQEGPQITTKTSVGGVNTFTLPDITTPVTGQQPTTTPQISFGKVPVDGFGLLQFYAAQPKLAKKLIGAVKKVALDPVLLAQLVSIYPGLADITLASSDADLLKALDPDVSFESSDAPGQPTVETVNTPTAKDPTYIAFLLSYSNNGSATVTNAVITDQIPAGTTLNNRDGFTYNGSVIIKNKPGKPGVDLDLPGDGTTVRFHLGDLAPGASGFVIYKVRVLDAEENGAPSIGAVITTSGSVLSSPDLSRTYIGQPDGHDLTVVGRYDYFLDSYAVQIAATGDSPVAEYDIPYQNTGSRASKILEIDEPIPAGLEFVTYQLLDGNHNPMPAANIQGGAVVLPADPTNGTIIFHPPLFNLAGKLKPGDGGYIRMFYLPLGTTTAFVHTPFIPASSYGTTSSARRGGAAPRATARPVTRDASSTAMLTATSRTLVDDGARAKVFVALVLPMTMVENVPTDVFVVEGSLNDQTINDTVAGDPIVTLPKGFTFGQTLLGTDTASATPTQNPDGTTSVDVDFVSELAGHSASVARFTITPQTGTAGQAPVQFPGCGVSFAFNEALALQTGPVKVRVMTRSEAASLPALKGQVAGAVLNQVDTSSQLFNGFTSNITAASHIAVLAGTSAVSVSNGAFVIPLLDGNVLAMGPAGTVGAQGAARSATTAAFDYVFATGATTDVTIGPAAGRNGAATSGQSAGTLLGGITTNASGNAVAMGAATLMNGGGATLISRDGSSLIGQDGGGIATGVNPASVISNDGGSYGAGLANTSGIISQDGGGIISQDGGGLISDKGNGIISQDGNGVISNDGGSIVATQSGLGLFASGANGAIGENSSGLIGENSSGLLGSPDQSAAIDANPGGCLNQVGSTTGLIGNVGGALTSALQHQPKHHSKK